MLSGPRAPTLPPKFDAFDPAVMADPYPAYARLRAAGPLCRMGPGTWGVTRHADVNALLRDPRASHHFPDEFYDVSVGAGPTSEFLKRILARFEPPEHTRLRELVARAFSPGLVRRLREQVGQRVDQLLAPALDTGHLDIVTDLAFPLTISMTGQLMGIPEHDWDRMPRGRGLAASAAPFLFPAREDGGPSPSDEAILWFGDYLRGVLAERRRHPTGDLISRMLAAEHEGGRLTDAEIIDNAIMTFFAGFETSISLIATGCAALLAHPEAQARLRADPALVTRAVEEFLRYDAGIHGAPRMVREPLRIGDRTIRPGRTIVLMLASANHDETVFADPGRVDVGRNPNPHVSFGGGPHYCLGAALTRVEGEVVFTRLLERFATLEPAGEPVREPSASFRTFLRLPVRVRPA